MIPLVQLPYLAEGDSILYECLRTLALRGVQDDFQIASVGPIAINGVYGGSASLFQSPLTISFYSKAPVGAVIFGGAKNGLAYNTSFTFASATGVLSVPIISAKNSTNWFNVRAYGAVADGSTDDAPAFNAAKAAAVAAGGGVVYAPNGTYAIASTFEIGDGVGGVTSTYASVRLVGDGGPVNHTMRGTTLKWIGAASGVMINVKGPISGISIENLILDANGVAATCLRTDHMSDSRGRNIMGVSVVGEGLIATAYPNPGTVTDGANEVVWDNVRMLSTYNGATGVRIGEPTFGTGYHLDVAQNVWIGLNVRCSGIPSTGLKLQFLDASFFYGSTISASTPVDIVPPTGGLSFPGNIIFSGFTGSWAFGVNAIANTTPIGVTVGVWGAPGTPTAHGYRTGDWVNIASSGVAAANGLFRVTVTGTNTFTLDGTVASGSAGTGGLIQCSGFQETSGTWATSPDAGIYCAGLNPEGWEYFPNGAPPPALTCLKGVMQTGQVFGAMGQNASTAPLFPGTLAFWAPKDETYGRLELATWSSSGHFPIFTFRKACGTATAPSSLTSGTALGGLYFYGYGSTGYSSTGRAVVLATAAETWTDTAHGTAVKIGVTQVGTLLENGSLKVENDGQLTNTMRTLAMKTPGVIFTQTADSVTTANTLTSLLGTGVGSKTLPANFFIPGRTIEIECGGYVSQADTAAGFKTLAAYLGATAIFSSATPATFLTVLNDMWIARATITCRTAGATGTFQGGGSLMTQIAASSAMFGPVGGNTATATVDTTVAQVLDLRLNNGSTPNGTFTTTWSKVKVLN